MEVFVKSVMKNSSIANVLVTSFGTTFEDFLKVNEHVGMNQHE